jgi:Ca2+-binding RTX toxin-like protein
LKERLAAPTGLAAARSARRRVRVTRGITHDKEQHRMRLNGTKTADQLHGTAQDDVIRGLAGDDLITGEGGSDSLSGGDGNDQLYGGASSYYGGYSMPVAASSTPALVSPAVAAGDTLDGGAGNDYLFGGDGADRLLGGDGDDYLNSSTYYWIDPSSSALGDDTLEGGAGNDQLSAGEGDDQLDGGSGADGLYGAGGGDKLLGGAGADTLSGGWGADTLNGGAGDDNYYSDHDGAADVLVFQAFSRGNFGHDQVSGFEAGADQLRFTGYTEAGLAVPVQTTTYEYESWGGYWDEYGNYYDSPVLSYSTEWRFEFKDGSRATVSFTDAAGHRDEGGAVVGTAPVVGQDYAFT